MPSKSLINKYTKAFVFSMSFGWGISSAQTDIEDFIYLESKGESVNLEKIHEEKGGFLLEDKYGNKTWVDNVDDPKCSFTGNKIEGNKDNFTHDLKSDVYVGNIGTYDCNVGRKHKKVNNNSNNSNKIREKLSESGGYIVKDEGGNEKWQKNTKKALCDLTASRIKENKDNDSFIDIIEVQVYADNINFEECN